MDRYSIEPICQNYRRKKCMEQMKCPKLLENN